jgi:hypothetical protein
MRDRRGCEGWTLFWMADLGDDDQGRLVDRIRRRHGKRTDDGCRRSAGV